MRELRFRRAEWPGEWSKQRRLHTRVSLRHRRRHHWPRGYAAFTIATSFYIGYVALGVGYIVARAMKFGSGGLGGRPFQIVAVILTYLAIALAEIPIALWEFRTRIPAGRMLIVGIRLLPVGLTSPIRELRDPIHGLINLVILFVGLRIAWRGTAAPKTTVEGPFRLKPAAS